MNKNGPMIFIDDDLDDQVLFKGIVALLGYPNDLLFFKDGLEALNYLKTSGVCPFIIFSDIKMPRMDGFELRNRIFEEESLRSKCTPYIFLTDQATPSSLEKAFGLSIQGFFKKPSTFSELDGIFRRVIEYWKVSLSP